MTNFQEDLARALHRRAENVAVENDLDAILEDRSIIRFSNDDGANPRRNRVLLVAAIIAVVVGAGGLTWATNSRTQPPAASSSAAATLDTSPMETASVPTPGITPVTIPAEFPSDVPRPDRFDLMTFIITDNEPVGWEFYDKREPTDSVERCTQYASSFDASWTPIPTTDVHPSMYAEAFDNGQWQVRIVCINDGGYLVQVWPAGTPTTAVTLPPPPPLTQ